MSRSLLRIVDQVPDEPVGATMTISHAASGLQGPKSTSEDRLFPLTLAALGVVFGDIGTSPLYTMREALGHSGLPLTVLGVLWILQERSRRCVVADDGAARRE
jgi:hypothetical protein